MGARCQRACRGGSENLRCGGMSMARRVSNLIGSCVVQTDGRGASQAIPGSSRQRSGLFRRKACAGAVLACLASFGGPGHALTVVDDSISGPLNISSGSFSDTLLIAGDGAGTTGTINLSGGTINVNHDGSAGGTGILTLGNAGTGVFNHGNVDGVAIVNIGVGAPPVDNNNLAQPYGGYLIIGRQNGGSGSYVMSDAGNGNQLALNVGNAIQIGGSNVGGFSCNLVDSCNGSFVQSGGIVTAAAIGIGFNGGVGSYTIHSGTLSVSGALDLGNTSAGDNRFTQNGGTVNLGGMFIANGAGSNGTYTFEEGVLNSGSFALIGLQGTGTFVQNGGVHSTDQLIIGNTSASRGTYRLNGGDLQVNGTLLLGRGDASFDTGLAGRFEQSGGTLTAGRIQIAGEFDGVDSHFGRGRFQLSGGTVDSQSTSVGWIAQGSVLQTGGTFNAGDLELGASGLFAVDLGNGFEFYSHGSYELQAGTLNTTGTTVGVFGIGEFSQSGGDHNVGGSLVVGSQPALVETNTNRSREGIYNLGGGNLSVTGITIIGRGNGVVGDPGFPNEPGALGTFIHSGGSFIAQSDVLIGQFGNIASGTGSYLMSGPSSSLLVDKGASMVVAQGGAIGTFQQSDGTVTVTGFLTIGEDVGAVGTYRLSGGTLTAGNTILGGGFVGNPGAGGVGSFEQSGGSFETAFLNMGGGGFAQKGQGFYFLTAGNLKVTDSFNMGNDVGGTALFDQSGGSVQLTGTGFGGGYINNGTYKLSGSGTLDAAGNLRVGGVSANPSGASATFNQSGSSKVTVVGDLSIGAVAGSDGRYNLSSTNVLALNTGRTIVGDAGFGQFTQSAGTHTTGQLIVGAQAGSQGVYNLLGGTLNDDAIVGDAGSGSMFVSAGTHNVTGNLILGNQASGNGSYHLSLSGQTVVSNNTIVGNFGTGNLSVTGTSSLSTGNHLTIGAAGNGTAIQLGGTVTAGGLRVGEGSTSTSSYTMTGGTLDVLSTEGVNGGSRIGLAGTGTFTNDGGTHNTTFLEIGGTNFAQGGGGTGTYQLNSGNLVASGIVSLNPQGGSQGVLNVAGGSLTAPLIINNDRVNYSGGSITANVTNNAQFNVSGAAARTVTGNVTNNSGGTLAVSAATPLLITGVLTQAASGAAIVAGANITIGKDYNNLGAGSGNAFDRRAGVSGAGQVLGLNAAQTITGQVSGAGANTFTLDLGNVRGGSGPVTKNYQIANSGTGADIRGAIQTAGLGNITDGRLSGSGATAGNFGPIVAGGNSGSLAVSFSGAAGGALSGQKVAIVSNFENVATQVINITGGAVSALAVGNATPNSPPTVDLGNFRVGTAGTIKNFDVQNQTAGAGAEQLGINSVIATTGFAGANAFGGGLIGPGATQLAAVTARADATGAAGVRTGTVTVNYATDGTAIDASFARQAANSQVINVQATGWNLANGLASPAGPINLGNFHVGLAGGAAPQNSAIDIANNAPNLGFTEQLKVGSAGVTGAFALTNNIGGALVSAGATSLNALNVARNGGAAGLNSGTIAIQYQSDGTVPGNSGFAAVDANSQQITVNATGYRLAQANTIAAVNFGNVHVGDTVSQALSISNTQIADAFSEKLNASFGGVSDARITTAGSINLLGAGLTNSSSMVVGLNTAAVGSVNGTAQVLLKSDGSGTSGLGLTDLPSQDVGVSGDITLSGSVFRLASASPVAPNPVNFGNVRVNALTDQALSITNTAANDGFSERLNASIGGATAGVTSNGGSFNLLGPQATNNTALHVGLDTSVAGGKSGTATITLVSDGAGTSGLGQTPLLSQMVTITGGVYNEARGAATPDPIVMHRRVNDAASQTLSVSNTAAAGAYSEALNASFQGATGAAGHNAGSISNLIAGGSNGAAMAVTLDTGSAGAKSGSVTLAYQTDGTGPNGNSGLAAAAAGTQVISVSGNVYTAAIAQVAPTTVDFGIVHKGDVVGTRVVSVTNAAAVTALNDSLTGSIGGAAGPFSASGNLGAGVGAGQTDSSSLRVGLNTTTAGVFNGAASVSLASHNADMTDLDLGSTGVDLLAQVNEYASLDYKKTGGAGGLVRNGNLFTLDFGNVARGSGPRSAVLDLLNDILGPADEADGAYCGTGTACDMDDFQFTGFNPFADLQAGASAGPMTVGFDTGSLGMFDDIIELSWFGHNVSGYRDAADTVFRLHILGSVFDDTGGTVPEPGNLLLVMTGLALLARSAARRGRQAPAQKRAPATATLAA